jgi:formylglycine-generating enzyme required for sulfatase activity
MDEGASRKSSPWPFLAIATLVVLLSIFLFLRWSRRGEGPVVVKPSPVVTAAPEPEPAPPAPPPAPPAPPPPAPEPPPPPAPDPKVEELRKLVETARRAVQEKRWDDALKALEAARAIKDEASILTPIKEAAVKGRQEEEAEARRKLETALAPLRERVEKLKLDSLYDAAMVELQKFEKEQPGAATDEPFRRLLKEVAEYRKDADTAYLKAMGEARRAFDEGRPPQALAFAERAVKLYPERREEVRKFQEQITAKMLLEKMVRIPEADFWIGGDDDRYPDEKPFRKVRLPAFYMDKYETTNEEYYAFTLAAERPPPRGWPKDGKPPKGREKHPVVGVTWEEAVQYAAWAGKRLPTAEEWEAAARGPGPQPYLFPWGNAFTEKENVFLCNCYEYWQAGRAHGSTTPVDQPPNAPSPFGVYGMGGNVWEWTATSAPAQGSKPPPEFRILKGGSFTTPQRAIRSSSVYAEDPRLAHPDVGFRCVRDVK